MKLILITTYIIMLIPIGYDLYLRRTNPEIDSYVWGQLTGICSILFFLGHVCMTGVLIYMFRLKLLDLLFDISTVGFLLFDVIVFLIGILTIKKSYRALALNHLIALPVMFYYVLTFFFGFSSSSTPLSILCICFVPFWIAGFLYLQPYWKEISL